MSTGLTERELDIMSVLWEHGPSTVAEVRRRLPADLAHTTVQTLLRIMEEKGHVGHQEEGKAHRFHAITAREAVTSTALRRLIDRLFGGSEAMLLAHLARDGRLDRGEVDELRRMLDERDDAARRPAEEGRS
jgi:predicted transcriptional regulator